MLGNCVVL